MKRQPVRVLFAFLILINAALTGRIVFAGPSDAAPVHAETVQNNSLAEAYRIIASKQFVDLTHSFSPLTPVWKGFGQATFSRAADPMTAQPYTIEKDHFRATSTRWWDSTALISTRPRTSIRTASRSTNFRSSK